MTVVAAAALIATGIGAAGFVFGLDVPVAGDPSEPAEILASVTQHQPLADQGLTDAFIAFVMPISADDLETAWTPYQGPLADQDIFALAACVESDGYPSIARGLREDARDESAPDSYLFPDLAWLREHDGLSAADAADPQATWPIHSLFNWTDAGGTESAVQGLAEDIELHADELGELTNADAADLLQVMTGCDSAVAQKPPAGDLDLARRAVEPVREQWFATLAALDHQPEIKPAIAGALGCLAGSAPDGSDPSSVDEWLAAVDNHAETLLDGTDTGLLESKTYRFALDRVYADCIEPVVAARAALREQARNERINSDLASLHELRDHLDHLLAG